MPVIQDEISGKLKPAFETPEEFAAKFEEFCELVDGDEKRPTMSELAWFMGFASRQSIYDYRKKEGFEYISNRIILFCERHLENQLFDGRGDGGLVFALKQFGWHDKQQIEHSEKVIDTGENEW